MVLPGYSHGQQKGPSGQWGEAPRELRPCLCPRSAGHTSRWGSVTGHRGSVPCSAGPVSPPPAPAAFSFPDCPRASPAPTKTRRSH